MNKTSQFFSYDEDVAHEELDTTQYPQKLYDIPKILIQPKIPSKFIRKWSEYADDTTVHKSVSAINGDLSFSMPIVQINLTPMLKINVDLVYMSNKDGIDYEIPLTKHFISIDHQKSIFKNDAIYYINSMGSKMTLENVKPNEFKMLEDIKGDVDVIYFPDQEYFVVESELEKMIYGKFGESGAVLYELSYNNWRETGDDPQSLIRLPVAWYLAERHSKSDGRSIYYRYETVEVPHQLNPKVSYTSEVMLKSIDDGNHVKVQFEYGTKQSSENEELKLKGDDGNLRMGNFLVDKHFLNRIKVETETYEQHFGLTYDLFDGKIRVPKALTQVMTDGKSEEVLSFNNQKTFEKFLPSKIGIFHGVTTKFTYDTQLIPPPHLEKKFLLKNRPVISYGSGIMSFASIIDIRVVLKIFNIKTFKLAKELTIFDNKPINNSSLQVGFSQNFMVVTYTTDNDRKLKIYHQNGNDNWHDKSTDYTYTKNSKVFTTGRDYIVVHDGLFLVVLQKKWNKMEWTKYDFQTGDEKMKVFIKGKSIFVREKSNLHVVYKDEDSKWNFKLLKSGLAPSAEKIANLFDINEEVSNAIRTALEDNEIKVMNNIVIISNLIFRPNGQFQTIFNFITINTDYNIEKEEEFTEDGEKISDVVHKLPFGNTVLILKYINVGNKLSLKVVDYEGEDPDYVKGVTNRNQKVYAKRQFIAEINENENLKKSAKENHIMKWSKYYPILDSGKNDLFFSADVKFHMTGEKWTKGITDNKREVKLGEFYKLIFDKTDPNKIELLSQKDENFKLDIILKRPSMMVNMYPQYIAYQPDDRITKLIVFDDGKSIVKHETFEKEELMFESNQGYFITIKTSNDLSHSEPYELFVRNMAKYLPEKPQIVIKMTEIMKNIPNWPQPIIGSSRSDVRVTNYERSFKVDKKLWTAVVKTMNGYTTDENGWAEYFISRNDEADVKQITSYYDNDKKLLKSEEKLKDTKDERDFSDNLLYDSSGSLQISNFIPYKKSENSFGFYGFEDYEELNEWTFSAERVIKNGFSLTGKNHLQISKDEKLEKSFIPKNKTEVYTVAAWMRSTSFILIKSTENFKAVISFSADGRDFTELYGILGKIKYKSGEWSNVEVTIDMPKLIRETYNSHRLQHKNLPEFDNVDIKITIMAIGPSKDSIDIDNVAFYPAPHKLNVNVYNDNREVIAAIHNDGQITRAYYDSMTNKEIARTKKNGKIEQLLVRSEGEKDIPKVVTKFSLSSGFHENMDEILYTNRWTMSNIQNFSVLPSQLIHDNESSDGIISVKDEKIMDEKSSALRLLVSLDSTKSSKFKLKFRSDSIKFISNGENQGELNINNRKIADIPKHFELVVFKYQKRTIVWINGIIKFDEILIDTWKGFSMNFSGKVAIKDIFVLNNPKVEVFYHNAFDEKQQVIKLVSEDSAFVTQYIYDKFGREIVNTKPTQIIKSPTEALLKFHKNFMKSFDPQTGKMKGDVVTENPNDEGFPYFQTIFFKNPLNEKQKVGQPGKDYSLHSNFSTTYTKDFKLPFLNAYFPDNQGYTKHAEDLSNGSKRILVLDKNGNKVAKYVRVPNFDDLFITFEHDADGRIVKILSPKYHEAAKTLTKTNETYQVGDYGLSDADKKLQDELCSHFKYDEHGNVIEKRTPDIGRQVFLYNSQNLLKFSITYNADPKDGQTIYYNYDNSGLLIETGHISRPVSIEYLKKFVESNFHTQAIEFQKIQFNEDKQKTIETINHDTTILEEIQYDENDEDKILSRKMTVPVLTESIQASFDLQKKFNGDNVELLTYPTTDEGNILKVKHTFNGVGQLIGIGTIEKPFCFARFTYDANGQPTSEIHELNNLNRKYGYNSPGFMNKIDDEFLTEEISYIDGGYGQQGYGDGIVMKTAYHAKWSDKFFEELKEKEKKSDDDYDDYKDGSIEKDENEGSQSKVNLRKESIDPVRNQIIQQKLPSSDSNSIEDLSETRSKRDVNHEQNLKLLKTKIRSIRNIKRQPVPISKLERTLKSFKGFSTDQDVKRDNFTNKNDNSFGIHKRNPYKSHSNDYETQYKDKVQKSLPNGTSKSLNHKSQAKRDTSSLTSRQSKINKILANPKLDSCIKSLQTTNFISNQSLRFSKILNTNAEVELPIKCYDDHIYDEISAKLQIPKHYGYRFTYGTHRELVKSKYFSTKDEEEAEPLQMSTFYGKVPGIDLYKSHNVFKLLRDKKFISVDQRRSKQSSAIGTKGTVSLIRDDDLNNLLDQLGQTENYEFMDLFLVIKQLILQNIETKKITNQQEFENIFLKWKSATTNTIKTQQDMLKKYAKILFNNLIQQQLLPTSISTLIYPIDRELVAALKNYSESQIVDIVGVVSKAFNYELLSTAFDTASYEIDANGNHKKFATGFESVKLEYYENTSKLKTLNMKGEEYRVDHDGYGNMTSAPHKGVKRIIYHPVSRRVMEVLMTDGGSIKFHYNAQGERILKQVYDSTYAITKEILYIRDEDGNVLMDRVMNFDQKDKTCYEIVTHYIYGPRGMIGFIRDDKFHSIFTDHSGSVRLIIRDGKVVASYDYLPYGEMMRKFISDDNADIRYLYHGKELDDEFQTYNFHARFYDPTIGRFLQTDPQSQYFSPYKFSGNSPISFIDPDGEFSILISIGFAILGAYLSTAAHNKSFNPAKWDWKDPGTYLSLASGAISGAFLPGGVKESWALFHHIALPATMALAAYISAAASNKSWNPFVWKFDDPETYSAIFFGISAGSSLTGGVKKFSNYARTLSLKGKILLYGFSSTTALTAFYTTGMALNKGNKQFWQWDFSNPETYKAMLDGFSLGVSMPMSTITLSKDIKGFFQNPRHFKEFFKNLTPKNIHNLKHILADRNHPLYQFVGAIGYGYLMGATKNKDFNPINWKQNIGTYAAVLNGMVKGKNLSRSIATTTKADIKAKLSSEWNDVKSIGTFIKSQGIAFRNVASSIRRMGGNVYIRVSQSPTALKIATDRMNEQIGLDTLRLVAAIANARQSFDRQTSLLSPCSARRRRKRVAQGICQTLSTNWNSVKDYFNRRDMDAVFRDTTILSDMPSILQFEEGYWTLKGSKHDDEPVEKNDVGTISFENRPSINSKPGLALVNTTIVEININDRQRRETFKPSIVVSDQVPGSTIYTRELGGKLEIYHQYTEPETKIALTANKDGTVEFYDTKNGIRIQELKDVKVLRLFGRQNEELKMNKGVFDIPENGIVKYIKDGQFQILTTINSALVREIANNNRQIRLKNKEILIKKFRNFVENCDTCKAIYWEDHLPVGVIDTAYNLNIDRQLKATVVIYKDDKDNWKLSSQLIQFNKEKGGALEIADIRPKPKIFDLKLTAKEAEQLNDNRSRKPRHVETVPEHDNIPAKNFKFIENNSAPNFNRQTPSVLNLGDFWLNATDFNSNLTLAYAFLKKLTNDTLFSTNEGNMPQISDAEFGIFANDLVYEFTENIQDISEKCGISEVMQDILEDINMQKISNEVKRKCVKNMTEEIPKYLMKEILDKNERKIVEKSSKKKFEKMRKLMSVYLEDFTDDMIARNDRMWNRE